MQVLIIDESMTKKKGFILERIADDCNLRLAIKNSQRGGKAKRRSDIRAVNADIDATVERLRGMILNLDFPEHRSRVVNRKADSGKMRRLDDEDYMPWKIMSHAIMQVIEPVINGKMIADTSSCIKGRGNLYGVRRMKRLLRRYPGHTWAAKSDCKKYYQGLNHGYMLRVLRHHFKDERFIRLMEICVFDYYCGEDIEKEIDDEREKKAGRANWRVHKRDDWQPRPHGDRPHPHRKVRGEAGAELRRHGDAGKDKGRGEVPPERLRPLGGGARDDGKGKQLLRTDSPL